ncbi:hypothetical protein CBS101457_004730 [Exobasidium rhododendri]|nr:hypothetical protein CBS101457_004730 [Exobasidium rhododendri]
MGVPALFRWLSKKYPRIVAHVEEEEPRTVPGKEGEEDEELAIDMSGPNPNGEEFDCLYLDMNGIVHPCTHPEGKPAPETEEEMMNEVFLYTERVVNMVRPRRLLMMAIDGVAPRAKMNQQRSRRFRAAQEAKEKEEETEKAIQEWKASGIPISDETTQKKKAWDSNAITPGTPFMDLLASSLRYWVARKLNQDPAWKGLQVIISDASVPGEGEHKIMDHIRRQRSQAEHDPNTKHVIYGLDADLIMLSLATHEPYFKVLREDVFAQDEKSRACHRCGKEGHFAANCIGEPKEKSGLHDEIGQKKPDKKPFIFLDVVALREYLEVELNIPNLGFPFDLERAIDDWVFLIFFVGNDFLPHLPSLEIREGAIDVLLKIWKSELPKMGSYLTNHGKVEMKNAQVILEGIGRQEDDIFRRRKEAEERQDSNFKRRKIEDEDRQRRDMAQEAFKHGEQSYVQGRAPIPSKPTTETKPGTVTETETVEDLKKQAIAALESGRNEDVISNQRAIRLANLSAAEKLRAELKGSANKKALTKSEAPAVKVEVGAEEEAVKKESDAEMESLVEDGKATVKTEGKDDDDGVTKLEEGREMHEGDSLTVASDVQTTSSRGTKRTADNMKDEDDDDDEEKTQIEVEDGKKEAEPIVEIIKQRKINADGTVEIEDTVQLWEPGYRERYYQQKFGHELSDAEFRRGVVKSYMEGLSWVLLYYYQGCPSWTWYYPYHFAPFAADFTDLESLEIKFDEGTPFRPYDQLMGVLPAASRASIPKVFHSLMTEEDSEIIDFYPEDFSIDMNGKKMAWQGVALLPFIDEKRLLKAINARYHELNEDEVRRNSFGSHALMVAEENELYDEFCALYAKRNSQDIENVMNAEHSGGITGSVKPDPDCVPGSTFNSPLTSIGLNDLVNDRSISVLYSFPSQKTPHRSVLLKGVKMPKRVLTEEDREMTRRGGTRGRGGRGGGGRGGGGSYNHHSHNTDYRSAANGHGGGPGLRMGNGPIGGMGRGGVASHSNRYGHDGGSGGGYNGGGGNYGSSSGGGGGGHGGNNGSAYGHYPAAPPPAREPHYQNQYRSQNNGGGDYGGAYQSPAQQRGTYTAAPYSAAPYGAPYGGSGNAAPYAAPYGNGGGDAPPYGGHGGSGNGGGGYGGYGISGGGGYAPPSQPSAPYGGYSQQQQTYGAPQGNQYGYAPPQAAAAAYGGNGQGYPPQNSYGGQAPPPPSSSGPPRPLGFRQDAPPSSRGGRRY